MALLYSEEVPQSADCETGPLWQNCNGQKVVPLDHETRQLFEDAEKSYSLNLNDVAVVFYFQTVNYRGSASKLEGVDFTLVIDIVANAAGAEKRQDIIDQVEERILFRLYSYADFIDASTSKTLRSFMNWLSNNGFSVMTTDNSSFAGKYTIRSMRFTVSTKECVEKPPCGDVPICFDFDLIPEFC